MKKEWKAPTLEMLAIDKTMASTNNGPKVDEAYVEGNYYEGPRFTS